MTNSLGGVHLLLLVFLLPGSDGGPPTVDMWRREHTVFAVIGFIATIMAFLVHCHRAGDVSQAKTEADCQKAGGMWEMNMCMEKKQSGDVSQAKIEADCQKAGGVWDSEMNMCMEK